MSQINMITKKDWVGERNNIQGQSQDSGCSYFMRSSYVYTKRNTLHS